MDESRAAKKSPDVAVATPTPTLIAERYRVLRVLGEGSSGIVYLCEHTALEKEVAVKLLHRELADNAGLVARFTREAQTAARLDHPNSVHVMDFGQDRDGMLYLAMEYVEGADLAELLQQKLPLSDERIVHYMSCILSALSAAHALGIVHRDLKPENVLVRLADPASGERDVVKVCDFGVAQHSPVRLARGSQSGPISTHTRRVTGEGMMVGTPWYMSPEQARAEALDARSDIYSAGVVLFQLLTRTLPFVADDVMAVALAHCTTPPPPPSGYCAVHPGLEAVCLKALSKTPDLRFQSATEMLDALHEAVAHQTGPRSLARVSKPAGTAITLAPVSLRAERLATTPLATPSVRMQAQSRKLRPSLLVAGVATALLGVAALPRVLPSQHSVHVLSAATSESVPEEIEAVPESAPAPEPVGTLSTEDEQASELGDSDSLQLLAAEPVAPTETKVAPATSPVPTGAAAPAPAAQAAPARPVANAPSVASVAAQSAKAVEPKEVPAAAAQPAAAEGHDVPPTSEEAPAPVVAIGGVASSEGDKPVSPQEAAASAAAIALATLPTLPKPQPKPQPKPEPVAPVVKPAPRKPVAFTRVEVSAEQLPPGVPRGVLRNALHSASLLACYADAQARSPEIEFPGTALKLKTNMSGHVVSAHATNGALPAALRECLEQVARTGSIRTGEGGAVEAVLGLLPAP